MARRHATRQDDTPIDITPMLDIVFIMLIFFIVTTSFVKETGIDPQRPEALTAIADARGNILIGIAESGQIWMERKPLDLSQVRAMVEIARARNPESSVIIIADEHAPTGTLVDLMDQVRLGGVQNVSVAAQPPGAR